MSQQRGAQTDSRSARGSVRLAAVGDLHCARTSQSLIQTIFAQAADSADALLLCGDLTNYGLPEEARILAEASKTASNIPILAVLGNHDFESGRQEEVKKILGAAGIVVLDGDAREVHGIGFAGVKGFLGGFGRLALQAWGEASIKRLVHETLEEALKLESALAKLRNEQKVVLLHYAPIQSTVEGEPAEIYPFLGSSRLEEPLNRYAVTSVFHGHSHYGSLEGKTSSGAPVYNVAMPLLRRAFGDRPPVRVVEMPATHESRSK